MAMLLFIVAEYLKICYTEGRRFSAENLTLSKKGSLLMVDIKTHHQKMNSTH